MGCSGSGLNISENKPSQLIKPMQEVKIVNYEIERVKESNKEALEKHNYYRKKHKVNELKLSEDLCRKAEKRIKDLIDNNTDYDEDDNDIGENLFIGSERKFDISDVCASWYNEKKNYDFKNDKCQSGTGHFTQMIWKETEEVGFGYSKLKDGKFYFLALYCPAGNELFRFKENVINCENNK